MSLDKLKTVPFSNEAEKSVLGGILLKQDVLEDIIEIVKINDTWKLYFLWNASFTLFKPSRPVPKRRITILPCINSNVFSVISS